jgi:hypothetical protein
MTRLRRAPADDDLANRLDFVVDPDAEPGDVVPAMARLLIGMARQRRERLAAESAAEHTRERMVKDGNDS